MNLEKRRQNPTSVTVPEQVVQPAVEQTDTASHSAELHRRKPCVKCLLRDLDEKTVMEQILRVIRGMSPSEKAEDALYEQRLDICRECSYLENGTCQACGCYVELRAASKRSRCPYKKW